MAGAPVLSGWADCMKRPPSIQGPALENRVKAICASTFAFTVAGRTDAGGAHAPWGQVRAFCDMQSHFWPARLPGEWPMRICGSRILIGVALQREIVPNTLFRRRVFFLRDRRHYLYRASSHRIAPPKQRSAVPICPDMCWPAGCRKWLRCKARNA